MKEITEKVPTYGMLYTTFGKFILLAPEPERHNLPWYLRDGAFSFYVVNDGDTGTHLIVRGDFGIELYRVPLELSVTFMVEDDVVERDNFEIQKGE